MSSGALAARPAGVATSKDTHERFLKVSQNTANLTLYVNVLRDLSIVSQLNTSFATKSPTRLVEPCQTRRVVVYVALDAS